MSDYDNAPRFTKMLNQQDETIAQLRARVADLEAENERLRASCEGETLDRLLSRLPGGIPAGGGSDE